MSLAAISLSVFGYYLTKREINEMNIILEDIMYNTKISEEEKIFEKSKKLIDQWNEVEKSLTILLKHSLAMDINQKVLYIENCIENKNKDELLTACYESHAQLSSVLKAEKPTISNIF